MVVVVVQEEVDSTTIVMGLVFMSRKQGGRWWQWQGQSGTSKDGGGCGVSKVGDGARGDDIFVFLLFLASEIKGKKLSIN